MSLTNFRLKKHYRADPKAVQHVKRACRRKVTDEEQVSAVYRIEKERNELDTIYKLGHQFKRFLQSKLNRNWDSYSWVKV